MGDMNIKQDIEKGEDSTQEEIRKPLMQGQKNLPDAGGSGSEDQTDQSSKEHLWMVYLSTFVAVCGSFEFGSCVSAGHLVILYYHIFISLNLQIMNQLSFQKKLDFIGVLLPSKCIIVFRVV